MKLIRIAACLFLLIGFLLGSAARAQTTPPPADIPISHISISASFNGYDSKGKMLPSTIDTLGVAVYRNTAATQGFNVAYEHIARNLVDDPDAVDIAVEERRSGDVTVIVHAGPGDVGRLIGKRGRVIQAIRQVARAAAASEGVRASVDVAD